MAGSPSSLLQAIAPDEGIALTLPPQATRAVKRYAQLSTSACHPVFTMGSRLLLSASASTLLTLRLLAHPCQKLFHYLWRDMRCAVKRCEKFIEHPSNQGRYFFSSSIFSARGFFTLARNTGNSAITSANSSGVSAIKSRLICSSRSCALSA
jgi:hypothetical protein